MSQKTHPIINKKAIVKLLFFALIAFYSILPLVFHTGLPYSHDIIFHVFQADQFTQAIHNGVFYPRWVLDSNNGYGSPSFVFYSPISYYIVTTIQFFVPSITIAMIIAIWCGLFFSGVNMYLAIKYLFGSSRAILPAILYQILPFHLSNIYTRGTFAEIFAFIWFPLILLFMYKTVISGNKYNIVGLSISYAALILTHLVSGFIFSLVIGAYFLYNYFLSGNKKPLIRTLCSLALGLGLSSIYLIPVIFERRFVQIDYIIHCAVGDYKKNFLFTWDKVQTVLRDFYIPLHSWVIVEVILFLCCFLLILKNKSRFPFGQLQNFFIFLFLLSFFLTTPLSRPIWDMVPGFPYLQFPWRWIPMMELSLCLLIGVVLSVDDMPSLKPTYLKKIFIYLLIVPVLMSLVTISKSKIIPEKLIDKTMLPAQVQKIVDIVEYTPIWVKDMKKIMSEPTNNKVSVITGSPAIAIREWNSEKRVIDIKANTPVLLRISTFYYPGWKAEIDSIAVPILTEKESGAMLINIPTGEHMLLLTFSDTPIRYYSKFVSLISIIVLSFLLFLQRRNLHPGKETYSGNSNHRKSK